MILKSDTKFEEKLICALENSMRNLANFHQSPWKCQSWDFDGILFSKVENAWAKYLQKRYVYWNWRMIKKFEEELNCPFKIDIRNLTNFDPSAQKS